MRREVRQRYQGSALGITWTLLAPLTVMAAYALVFHYVYRVVDISDYPLFLLSGMVTWFFFAGTAQGAASSLVANGNLIKKVRFPREFIPLSVLGGQGVTMLTMLAVLIPLNLIFVPASRSPAMALLPLWLVLLGMMAFGFALLVSAINVYLRDVEHILSALLLPWFFITPIFYTYDSLPAGAQEFQWLTVLIEWVNWVAPFVVVIQDALFFGAWPSVSQVLFCVVMAVGLLALGISVFRRLEGEMAVEL